MESSASQLTAGLIENVTALTQMERLLTRAFPVPQGGSFYDDFSVWDPIHGASVMRIGAFDQDHLVGCAAVRFTELNAAEGTLPVAIIGAVATHPDHRGKGLATALVRELVEAARDRGSSVVLLWGSEHSMYERLGFELCGEQVRVSLDQFSSHRLLSGESLQAGWCEEIGQSLMHRTSGLKIKEKDLEWVQAHSNVNWWTLRDDQGVRAFAAEGRGIDLVSLIHEWGGEPEALQRLLGALSRKKSGLEIIGSPELLAPLGAKWESTEFLCMAQILDAQTLLKAFRIGGAFSDEHLCKKLFGPVASGESHRAIPLWIWGLDSA